MRNPQRAAAVTVSVVALTFIAGTAFAGTALSNLTVGRNDKSSTIYLQGPISNPGKYPDGKQRPLNIADNLAIKGDVQILANKALKAEGSNWLNVTSPLDVSKSLRLGGNLIFTGGGWITSPNYAIGIDDDLVVKGSTYLTQLAAGSTTLASLQVTGAAGFTSAAVTGTLAAATGGFTGNAAVGGNLGISGNETITGNLDLRGALLAGPYNVGTVITSNAALTNRLSGMIDCVGTFAQFTVSLDSDDYIFCFNTWMAGQPGTVSLSSLTALERAQVEKAKTQLSRDPVTSLPVSLSPIR